MKISPIFIKSGGGAPRARIEVINIYLPTTIWEMARA
jgi:hypothetical protein